MVGFCSVGFRYSALRRFAREGLPLYGPLLGLEGGTLRFAPDLREHLDSADRTYDGINATIDALIAKQGVDAPGFNGRGQPAHQRGVSGRPGLCFLGLPWLHTWGSGRFSGSRATRSASPSGSKAHVAGPL